MHKLLGNGFLVACIFLSSCGLYKRDVLFRASKEKEKEFLEASKHLQIPKNYLISKNDFLEFQIFTNKGEIIIDPTTELAKQASGTGSTSPNKTKYLVQSDGCADLPILGHTKIDSLTLHQCDSLLASLYNKFYLDVFVVSKISNRRVFLMGTGQSSLFGSTTGGSRAQVFDLDNENVTLIEILTKAGGVGQYGFADRVKVLRGNPSNPTIFTVDLTHWDSFQQSNLVLQPNDIIYIEPLRRKSIEFLRDISQVTGILGTVLSIYLLTRL